MPSARPSAFKESGGGLLRKVDATIVGLEFIQKDFDATPAKPANLKMGIAAQPAREGSSALQAQLTVMVDGATDTIQPFALGVGRVADYEFEGATISGETPLSKSSGWYIFLQSLVDAGFPEDAFPDDPVVADYSALIGARVQFDWRINEKLTAKYGKKVSKKINAKTGKPYENDREDLIVNAYYGQADAVKPVAGAKAAAGKPAVKAAKAAPKAAAVDVPTLAGATILAAVTAAKDQKLTKSKLSVKILNLLASAGPETQQDVREFAFVDDNLLAVDGINYDVASQTLTLEA